MKYQADASPQRFPIPKLSILLDLESDRELLVLYVTSALMKSSGWNTFVGQGLFLASDGNLYNASKGPLKALKLLSDSVDCRKWNGLATIEMSARYLEFAISLLSSTDDIDLVLSDDVRRYLDNKRAIYDAPIDVRYFEGEPFPHQEEAVRWLRSRFSEGKGFALIADDQGVGKTLEICAFLGDLYAHCEKTNTLIVCPASVIQSWSDHLTKHLAKLTKHLPELGVSIVSGSPNERKKQLEQFKESSEERIYGIAVTSVGMMLRDEAILSTIHWDCLVLDEADKVKNHASKNRSALRRIHADMRIGLTGTPAPNGSPKELHGIINCLSQDDYLGSEKAFNRRFTRPIVDKGSKDAAEALKHLVKPCMLRRLKSDVLSLPEKKESEILVELPEEQLEAYKSFESHLRTRLQDMTDDEFQTEHIGVIGAFTHLRQIAVNPTAVLPGYSGRAVKIEMATEMASRLVEEGHRVVIFTLFVKEIVDPLCRRLESVGIKHAVLTGYVPVAERAALINDFCSDGGPRVFVMSSAGGEGINLQAADVQIQLSPFYNHAVTDQAADRIHRIGQSKETHIYKLIAKDTIEVRMKELQDQKWSTSSSLMRQGVRPLTKLTRAELLDLLG